MHGLGEHVNRYEDFFTKFTARGIRIHAFDLRGHGRTLELNRSRMVRGHLGDLKLAVKDVNVLLNLDAGSGNTPRFLVLFWPRGPPWLISSSRWDTAWGD